MATVRIIDIAVNFTDNMFKGIYNGKQCHSADISAVLTRAWSAGVDRIIVTGGSLEDSKEALAIAETDGFFVPLVCTPQDAKNLMRAGIQKNIFRHFSPWLKRDLPKERFCAGVTHSFTGTAEDRDRLLSFSNLFIGVNGCSLKTAENLDVVKRIPVERMMIETDSPYCEIKNTHVGAHFIRSVWPSKKKEKYDQECIVKGRNEPCSVRQVLEVVAGCKGIGDLDQLSKTFYHNTCRVFFPHDIDSLADALLSGGQKAM